jgi:hypothetical protein
MSFWIIRKRFLVTAVIVVGTAFVGALFYAPNVGLDEPLRPIAVWTISIIESPGSVVSRTAHMEYEASKGLIFGFRWPEE